MKKAATVLLTLIMALQLTAGFRAEAATFTDTADTYENARAAIEKWADYGIINGIGDGLFGPQQYFRRYQMAVMIDKIMGYTQTIANNYTDLDGNAYAPYILRCAAAGVFDSVGAFRPDDYITREEAAVAFARALGVEYVKFDMTPSQLADDAAIGASARGAIKAMVSRGVINGIIENGKTYFKPKDNIKRQDMSVMFSMALDALVNKTGASAASGKTYARSVVINTPGAVLSNARIYGDLIIAEGVGEGDVTLNNVTVGGQLIIKAGGANSVHITGRSNIANINVNKRSRNVVSVKVSKDATVRGMDIANGRVRLTGEGEDSPSLGNITLADKGAELIVDKSVSVNNVTVSPSATGAIVTIDGTVYTLDVAAGSAAIEVNGVVVTLTLSADNASVTVSGDVTEVVLEAPNIELVVTGTVEKVTVTENAENATVVAGETSSVGYMEVAANGLTVDGAAQIALIGVTQEVTEKPIDSGKNDVKVVVIIDDAPQTQTAATTSGGTDTGGTSGVGASRDRDTSRPSEPSTPTPTPAPAPTVSSVTVAPGSVTLSGGATQQFSATVSGTNSPAQTVTWSVSGGSGSSTISSGGLLSVSMADAGNSLTVTATSTVDTTKKGTASVMVNQVPPVITNGLTVGQQTGTLTAGVAGSVTFGITLDVTLTTPSALTITWDSQQPAGITPSTNPTDISDTATLTMAGDTNTVAGSYGFKAALTDDTSVFGNGTLVISPAPTPTSSTPTADVTTVMKATSTQNQVDFTLTNNPALTGDWVVYNANTGTDVPSGITITVSSSTLSIKHNTDVPAAIYYVAVTENGKLISDRLALTVGAPLAAIPNATLTVKSTLSVQNDIKLDGEIVKIYTTKEETLATDANGYTALKTMLGNLATNDKIAVDASGNITGITQSATLELVNITGKSTTFQNTYYQNGKRSNDTGGSTKAAVYYDADDPQPQNAAGSPFTVYVGTNTGLSGSPVSATLKNDWFIDFNIAIAPYTNAAVLKLNGVVIDSGKYAVSVGDSRFIRYSLYELDTNKLRISLATIALEDPANGKIIFTLEEAGKPTQTLEITVPSKNPLTLSGAHAVTDNGGSGTVAAGSANEYTYTGTGYVAWSIPTQPPLSTIGTTYGILHFAFASGTDANTTFFTKKVYAYEDGSNSTSYGFTAPETASGSEGELGLWVGAVGSKGKYTQTYYVATANRYGNCQIVLHVDVESTLPRNPYPTE